MRVTLEFASLVEFEALMDHLIMFGWPKVEDDE